MPIIGLHSGQPLQRFREREPGTSPLGSLAAQHLGGKRYECQSWSGPQHVHADFRQHRDSGAVLRIHGSSVQGGQDQARQEAGDGTRNGRGS